MSEKLTYEKYSAKAAGLMKNSIFLTTKANDKVNTMTIGWGTIGIIWGKPVFMVMVRKSRFTKTLIDQSKEFTVSFPTPLNDQIQIALNFCGTKSGRDMDKISAASLNTKEAQEINTPIIDIPGLHLECVVALAEDMSGSTLSKEFNDAFYPDKSDYHTLYFGKIVAAYETK
ncbi:flavin reductase family protein [Selenomonadales bacterium OttesenSCG-928-I06]|nr:flavin reductase family protein [Selenomonadales bacterium OttesenSCG-928-I06]